jgi:hypothetical protein
VFNRRIFGRQAFRLICLRVNGSHRKDLRQLVWDFWKICGLLQTVVQIFSEYFLRLGCREDIFGSNLPTKLEFRIKRGAC